MLVFARLVCAAAMGLLVSACGPVDYLYTVTAKGTRAVADAKTAGAEKLAPYEYWSAVTFLRMAREKAGSADYEIAVDYGDRAVEMGRTAKRLASERAAAGPGAKPPEPEPEVIDSSGDGAK